MSGPGPRASTREPARTVLPWQESAWRRLCRQREEGALAHAYLFCGDRGTGRMAFIREFADLLLCEKPQNNRACRQCRSCRAGGAEHHPDQLILAPEEDRKDIGIGQVRELAEFMSRSGFSGLSRVAVVTQAEKLTLAAANALLKTLEEPPERACLLLAAVSPGSLLPTIRSRCQILPLPRPDRETAKNWLRGQLGGVTDQTQDDLLEDALESAGNRPLEALAELQSDQPASPGACRKLLLDLLSGAISPQQAAAAAAKIGDMAVFEQLDRISTILIRSLVTGTWRNAANRQLAQALPASGNLAALLAFHRQVALARKLLAGPGNPNPQLLLESIFLHWRRRLLGKRYERFNAEGGSI